MSIFILLIVLFLAEIVIMKASTFIFGSNIETLEGEEQYVMDDYYISVSYDSDSRDRNIYTLCDDT